jgi:PD-(D/E)XK nuclease superfamily
MKRITIEPLKPWYKIIQERWTWLEAFMQCAYKAKFQDQSTQQSLEDTEKKYDIFEYWDIFHSVFQTYAINSLRWQEQYEHVMRSWLLSWENADNLSKLFAQFKVKWPERTKWDDILYVERKLKVAIAYWDYLLILELTPDVIMRSWKIYDFKTSKSKWTDQSIQSKWQRFIYPPVYALYEKNSNNEFAYIVWDKAKRDPRLMIVEQPISKQETYDLFIDLIIYYIESIRNNTYEAQPIIPWMCNACPLKPLCPKHDNPLF